MSYFGKGNWSKAAPCLLLLMLQLSDCAEPELNANDFHPDKFPRVVDLRKEFDSMVFYQLPPQPVHISSDTTGINSSILMKTNNPLDIAINGEAYFEVAMPDGSVAYTRDDSFHVNQNGELLTASGYPVVPQIVLPVDYANFTVSGNGIVSVTDMGEIIPRNIGQMMVVSFINKGALESLGNGLFKETLSSGSANQRIPGLNGAPEVYQGYVKKPNYGVVEELVNVITAQRAYEEKMKTQSTADETLKRLTQF
nr:venom polypeptide precursor [Doratifera vulnerans]